jgi:hypothetical protein
VPNERGNRRRDEASTRGAGSTSAPDPSPRLEGCRAFIMKRPFVAAPVGRAEHGFRNDLSASFLRQRHRRTAWGSLFERAVRSRPVTDYSGAVPTDYNR